MSKTIEEQVSKYDDFEYLDQSILEDELRKRDLIAREEGKQSVRDEILEMYKRDELTDEFIRDILLLAKSPF